MTHDAAGEDDAKDHRPVLTDQHRNIVIYFAGVEVWADLTDPTSVHFFRNVL
ncbi:hypothetical protein GMPD_37870 [Geomonas paludis]|uniref:Uncharacterized protein n=1 Tax=Geomonas paludis TaxID=2740185 RepID=A0A6V8N052_9BACT|nr:hypothetical protein GMPD_37870 [Geomonas paludis]